MGAQGTTEVDFGAWPGIVEKEVDVTGQTGFVSTSLSEAWLYPKATTDHNADEHIAMGDYLHIQARYKVDGTLTIRVAPKDIYRDVDDFTSGMIQDGGHPRGVTKQRTYGKWTIAWVWN